MKLLLAVLPTILLTLYSQLMIKWRVAALAADSARALGPFDRAYTYLFDPYVISAYVVGLLSSFAWFFVVEKYPVSVAFPVYIGVLFSLVTIGSTQLLRETVSLQHVVGLALIMVGVVVVSRAA